MPLPESLQRLRAQIFGGGALKSPERTDNRYGPPSRPAYMVGPGGLVDGQNPRAPVPQQKEQYIGAPTLPIDPREGSGELGWRRTDAGGWELAETRPALPIAVLGSGYDAAPDTGPDMTSEPWLAPAPAVGMNVGDPAPQRGMEPPSAPMGPTQYDQEAIAWAQAQARARAQLDEERRAEMARIPRPGYPLIAQAWSDPPGALRRRRDGR